MTSYFSYSSPDRPVFSFLTRWNWATETGTGIEELHFQLLVQCESFHLSTGKPTSPVVGHSCPTNVIEGNDLDCTCACSDLGMPAGSLRWNASSASSRLLLRSVNRSHAGRVFSCQLLWNGTAMASIDYSFGVMCELSESQS